MTHLTKRFVRPLLFRPIAGAERRKEESGVVPEEKREEKRKAGLDDKESKN